MTIQNNTELLWPESGTYPYSLGINPGTGMCNSTITINNESDFCFLLNGDEMSFDLSMFDGLKLNLKR